MYNRYFSQEDYVPVEPEREQARKPEQEPRSASASDRRGSSPLSLLSTLLGGGGGETSKQSDSPLTGLLGKLGLDGGDSLLLLILIYLFRETEDEEWLIILALILLMGL